MDIQALKDHIPTSPAFVVDEAGLIKSLDTLSRLREDSGCKLLYSIKALPLHRVLEIIKPYIDGFSVSSLFEARLAEEVLTGQGRIHLTTPGIRPEEVAELAALCSHISCNSINQFRQLTQTAPNKASIGLRINPKLSFTYDVRHDPCRSYSKLGVAFNDPLLSNLPKNIKGLHFHTVYSETNLAPLVQTVGKLRQLISDNLATLDWLNLGGGYLYDQMSDKRSFVDLIRQFKTEFAGEIFIEPGNTIVGKAAYLLATVIDCFDSDGKVVAVLDSSVNHHPQVFEYQLQPEVHGHEPDGDYPVILAGSTCLAGDLFGEYRFKQPLKVGDKVVFKHVGAYSLAKANRFNGYNLPDVYLADNDWVRLIKNYTYQDYKQLWTTN